jgi:hypothetical protein
VKFKSSPNIPRKCGVRESSSIKGKPATSSRHRRRRGQGHSQHSHTMAIKRPFSILKLPAVARQSICLQCRFLHAGNPTTPKIPRPTPFVPDPQTFLTLIGRNMALRGKRSSPSRLSNCASLGLSPRAQGDTFCGGESVSGMD